MARMLRQSTSRVVRIGPVVAVGDGFTPVTTLALSTADEAEALRENTATLDISGATFAAITGADGYYSLTLSTTATNTCGELIVAINDDSLCLPVRETFHVVEEAIYDALFAASATGLLPANVTQFGGSAGTFASGRPEVNTTHAAGTAWGSGAITAGAIAADAIGASELAADAASEIATAVTTALGTGSGLTTLATAVELAKVPKSDSNVSWNATALAAINAQADTALADYDGPTNAEMEARTLVAANYATASALQTVDDELATVDSNVDAILTDTADIQPKIGTPSTSLAADIAALSTSAAPQLLQSTTIATLASQTSFTLTAGSADDDAYNGAIVVVTDQSTATQKAVGSVLDYTGSTKTVTLSADPGIFTMATGDSVDILAAIGSAPSAAAIRAEIDSNSTQLAAIVADTDELQGDWADGGRLDLILDARASQTTADAIETDTQDIQSRIPAALVSGRMSSDAVAISGSTSAADAVESNIGNLDDAVSDAVAAPAAALTAYDPPTKAELDAAHSTTDGLITTVDNVVDAILVDTADMQPKFGTIPNLGSGATIGQNHTDIIGTGSSTLSQVVGTRADTEDIQSRLPAALVSGRMSSDAVAISGSTSAADAVEANIGNLDDAVSDAVAAPAAALTSYDPPTKAELDAAHSTTDGLITTVDTVVDAIKVITDALGATAAARLAQSAGQIIPGTVDSTATTPTTTVFEADDITEATADHYIGRVILFTSGALAGQATDITDYALNGGRGQFTTTALTEAPGDDDAFIIV